MLSVAAVQAAAATVCWLCREIPTGSARCIALAENYWASPLPAFGLEGSGAPERFWKSRI